jgi:bacterioferritin-associated ferredoxin
MYVCICNGVTDRQVREAAEGGCATLPELTMRTGLGATCGSCLALADAIMAEVRASRELPLPLLSRAA